MTNHIKWCDKAAAKVKELHELNIAAKDVDENSKEALVAIGKLVAEHVGHKGEQPTVSRVRSKLSSLGVYVAKTTAAKPKGGTVISKDSIVTGLQEKLGIDVSIGTLTNANRADLEKVAQRVVMLLELSVHNASRDQLELALDNLKDAEQDAIAGDLDPSDIAEVEEAAAEAVGEAETPE